jgi:hypothetical protein
LQTENRTRAEAAMSQGAVERALGKLVTDDAFRARFFAEPTVASVTAGLERSGAELEARSRRPQRVLAQFSRRLDARLRRRPCNEEQGSVSPPRIRRGGGMAVGRVSEGD